MHPLRPRRRWFRSRRDRSSASADAARRATRARDHLERKRTQERRRRERERAQADRKPVRIPFRRTISLFALLLATAAGIFAAGPLNHRVLAPPSGLERIDVQGASALTPAEIVRVAGLGPGSARESLDTQQIVAALQSEPWIESARVLRLPTGTLVLSVVERSAIAIWQTDAKSEPRLVDRAGQRFDGALAPAGDLPRVSGDSGVQGAETEKLPGDAIEILNAIERYASAGELPSGLTLYLPVIQNDDDVGYVLQLGEDGPRAVLGRQLYSERLARLAALVESGESTFQRARLIDLRYADRAVLRTEPISG